MAPLAHAGRLAAYRAYPVLLALDNLRAFPLSSDDSGAKQKKGGTILIAPPFLF